MENSVQNIAVVGSGLIGPVIAIMLAKKGFSVEIFDAGRKSEVGKIDD